MQTLRDKRGRAKVVPIQANKPMRRSFLDWPSLRRLDFETALVDA
jgi:hypothetical protein